MEYTISGEFEARELIEFFIKKEFQFEIHTAEQKLLVVFLKGTWALQDSVSRDFVQIYDAPCVTESGIHTYGLCDEANSQVNPLWLGFLKQRLDSHLNATNGQVLTRANWDIDPTRTVPAKALTDLILMIDPLVTRLHVVQASRDGYIKNGQINGR